MSWPGSFSGKSVLPGFSISLGSSLFFISLVILLPVSGLVLQVAELSWTQYWSIITDPRVVASYRATVSAALVASVFNMFFGLLMAWILTRYSFPGRALLDGLMDMPFVLPTAVAGLTLAAVFAEQGWYGQYLAVWDIKVSYSWLGIVVAMTFTSVPFVVRSVQPVLEEVATEYEEAAATLGASPFQTFVKVIFPEIKPALLTGTALSFTRSLGEFGAVIFIAGNLPWQTEVTSLMIFVRLQEFDYAAAAAIASLVLFVSLLLLFVINGVQQRYQHITGGLK